MPKERWNLSPKAKRRIRVATTIGLALAVLPPVLHIDTTTRVIKALSGQSVTDCTEGLTNQPYDIMAIADGGPAQDDTIPGPTTRRNAQAAAIWYVEQYRKGLAPTKIVDLSGPDKQRPNVNTLYFLKQVQKIDPSIKIPHEQFVTDNSINTSGGVRALRDIFKDGGYHKLAAFTPKSQADRFAIMSCVDIPTTVFESEAMLIAHDPDRAAQLNPILNSQAMQDKLMLEKFKIIPLPWDTSGQYLTLAKEARNYIRSSPFGNWVKQK